MADPSSLLLLGQRIKHCYGALCRDVELAYGLTRNEIDVLLFLANNPGCDTARDIVELRGLSKSHVCKSVDALTRRGWLAGAQDARDRRCVRLRLLPPLTLTAHDVDMALEVLAEVLGAMEPTAPKEQA